MALLRPAASHQTWRTFQNVRRRMACDCDLIRVLLGARDAHCAFPGCTRPPVMCHAHHIRHWADGGPTSLDNLVLLCGHHHRTPWEVRLAADRRPEFRPPAKPGRPPPDWIRHRPRHEGSIHPLGSRPAAQ